VVHSHSREFFLKHKIDYLKLKEKMKKLTYEALDKIITPGVNNSAIKFAKLD